MKAILEFFYYMFEPYGTDYIEEENILFDEDSFSEN